MAVRKVDMNELSDAVEHWFMAYQADFHKSDPDDLLMDGLQDEAVLTTCAAVVEHGGAQVIWPDNPADGAEALTESPEVRYAAMFSVAQHLDGFQDSMACEDLWENFPELTEDQMTEATKLAELIASNTHDALLQGFAILDRKKNTP